MLLGILNYLKKYNTATADEISRELGLEKSFVQAALDELIAKGRVERRSIKPQTCSGCNGCTASACFEIDVYCVKIRDLSPEN